MLEYFNGQGINTYNNPLEYDGQLIHGLNITGFPMGGYSKRGGYASFLNNPDSSQVNALFVFPLMSGTQLYLYRASGSHLYYSTQGTGNFTQATPGTIKNGAYVGNAAFNGTLCIGDGNTQLWTTSDGINFSQPSSSPVAQYLTTFHNRLYTTDGTTSNVQYSTANDPTNWLNSGTSDSSFLVTTSPGACQNIFVAGNMLQIPKFRGDIFTWDDTDLTDTSTIFGPTSPKSVAQIDTTWFYTNQLGIFSTDGVNKEVLSNPIQRQFYNRLGEGVSGNFFGNSGSAIATTYKWDYLVQVGDLTDDFTGKKITNAIIKYDYQKNQFLNWQFANTPTAMYSYHDVNNNNQFIFGDSAGNVYQFDLTNPSDNGNPIQTEMIFLFTYASEQQGFSQTSASMQLGSSYEKIWRWLRLFFNPGNEINIQYSFSNSLSPNHQVWSEAINVKSNARGDYWQESDGVVEIRFDRRDPANMPRSRFLFLKIYDYSHTSAWSYYGCQIDADPQIIK